MYFSTPSRILSESGRARAKVKSSRSRKLPFDPVCHLGAIAERTQDVVGQGELVPKIGRLIDPLATGELTAGIDAVEEHRKAILMSKLPSKVRCQDLTQTKAEGRLGLQKGRHKTHLTE